MTQCVSCVGSGGDTGLYRYHLYLSNTPTTRVITSQLRQHLKKLDTCLGQSFYHPSAHLQSTVSICSSLKPKTSYCTVGYLGVISSISLCLFVSSLDQSGRLISHPSALFLTGDTVTVSALMTWWLYLLW